MPSDLPAGPEPMAPAPAAGPVEPTENRLHPLSIGFAFLAELRGCILPGAVALFGASAAGLAWQAWTLPFLIPQLLISTGRYFRFRYRFEATELVIRSGLFSRQERHIPYARVQSVDAVQKLLHRPFGVFEVRVETGGGEEEPEAALRVLSLAAYEEMRRRVGEARRPLAAASEVDPEARVEEGGRVLLALPPRELLLSGLIENRGFIILAVLFGLYWESQWVGVDFSPGSWGGKETARQTFRDLMPSMKFLGDWSGSRIVLILAAVVAFVVLLRPVSAVWALVRLYGFRLRREGEVLRTEHGLLTRVIASIPLHRIQAITIHEGPLHRGFGRVSMKVETAGSGGGTGGGGDESGDARREKLAPLLRREKLPELLREVLPAVDLAAIDWRPPAPGAFRRVVKGGLILSLLLSVAAFLALKLWGFVVLALLVAWSAVLARFTVKNLGWAVAGDSVLYRSGWIWRDVTIAPCAKVQAVDLRESPMDRRAGMARVRVDTAGAGSSSHRIEIPYLTRAEAGALFDLLATRAARSPFRW